MESLKPTSKNSQTILNSLPRQQFYCFGPFELEVEERVLWRAGEAVALTHKAVEVLLVLLEQAGRTVSKQTLLDRVWPDAFVIEHNLTQSISALRAALGEDSHNPNYIATVHGRGYKFAAPVTENWRALEPLPAAIAATATTAPLGLPATVPTALPDQRRFGQWWWRSAGGIASVALLVGAVWWWWRPLPCPVNEPSQLQVNNFFDVNNVAGATLVWSRLSPDGKMIAYSLSGNKGYIWLRQIDSISKRQLTHDLAGEQVNDSNPVWSHDGQRIAYLSNRGGRTGVWVTPQLSDESVPLAALPDDIAARTNERPDLLLWGKSGWLYLTWRHELYRLHAQGKQWEKLTDFAAQGHQPEALSIAPDEERLAFVEARQNQIDLWWQPVPGGTPTQITNDAAVEQMPLWLPDCDCLLYSATKPSGKAIYAVGLRNRTPTLVLESPSNYRLADVSADGSKLLCYTEEMKADLARVNLTSGTVEPVAERQALELFPAVSAKGDLVFQMILDKRYLADPRRTALALKSGIHESPTQIDAKPFASEGFEPQWSADGEQLAFLRLTAPPGTQKDLWIIPRAGGAPRQLTTEGVRDLGYTTGPYYNNAVSRSFSWSRDNQRLVYGSPAGGSANLWVVNADGSAREKLTTNQDSKLRYLSPHWSPDEQHLAYLVQTNAPPAANELAWELRRFSLAQETDTVFLRTAEFPRLLGWLDNNRILLALIEDKNRARAYPTTVELLAVDVASGHQTRLPRLDDTYLLTTTLSPDGRNLSFVKTHGDEQSVWLLPLANGRAGLPQELPATKSRAYLAGLAWSPDSKSLYYGLQTTTNFLTVIDPLKK